MGGKKNYSIVLAVAVAAAYVGSGGRIFADTIANSIANPDSLGITGYGVVSGVVTTLNYVEPQVQVPAAREALTFYLPLFDPSLGTLIGVTRTGDAGYSAVFEVQQTSTTPTVYAGSFIFEGTSADLGMPPTTALFGTSDSVVVDSSTSNRQETLLGLANYSDSITTNLNLFTASGGATAAAYTLYTYIDGSGAEGATTGDTGGAAAGGGVSHNYQFTPATSNASTIMSIGDNGTNGCLPYTTILTINTTRTFGTLTIGTVGCDTLAAVNLISPGILTVGTVNIRSVGQFNQGGGTLTVGTAFNNGGASSFTGGTTTFASVLGTGSMVLGSVAITTGSFTQGSLAITGNATINSTLSTPSISATLLTINTGSSLTSDSIIAGTFNVYGNQTFRTVGTNSGASKVSTLYIDHTGSGTSASYTGQIQLADSKFILQSTGSSDKTAKIASLNEAITFGFNDWAWNGNGITSSVAAADTWYALGVWDNAIMGKTTWGGVTVDSDSILVGIAHLGDANRDGVVDIQDETIVDNNWGSTADNWAQGDLNRDGIVDIQDATIVANSWNKTSSYYSISPSIASSTGIAAVPEPATLAAAGIAAAWLLLGRRTKSQMRSDRGK